MRRKPLATDCGLPLQVSKITTDKPGTCVIERRSRKVAMPSAKTSNEAIVHYLTSVDVALCAPDAFAEACGEREEEWRIVKRAFMRRALKTHPDKTKASAVVFHELIDA